MDDEVEAAIRRNATDFEVVETKARTGAIMRIMVSVDTLFL